MVFFVSLSVFPSVQADIESTGTLFSHDYFAPVTTFFTFNFFAMSGNIVCATDKIPKPGPKYLWIPVFLRLLFIPFFLFCNFNPENRAWPVLIPNDYVYWVGAMLLGFTSGYFSSLCMMFAPKSVKPEDAEMAGMMAAFFLIFGIFSGVCFSNALAAIVIV
jgi:equilibrative nucleoside transporter 1/2/3